MRKSLVLGILGILVLSLCDSESSACCRRRQRCHCVVVCCPSTWAPAQPTVVARPQIISSKPFMSPGGRRYLIHQTTYQDLHEEPQISTDARAEAAAGPDNFRGTDRKTAKTSIVPGAPDTYSSLADLLDALPSDQTMLGMGISKDPGSPRVPDELHNVTVPAYIYASSKEKDNDYHVVLGSADASRTGTFMNAEISGLPTGSFRQRLTVPRQAFNEFFGNDLPGRSYAIYDPPISVTVTGSLFYDVDHLPGVVGPDGYKPQTAWEIHPISTIVFEP
jgi:hypothetical protein